MSRREVDEIDQHRRRREDRERHPVLTRDQDVDRPDRERVREPERDELDGDADRSGERRDEARDRRGPWGVRRRAGGGCCRCAHSLAESKGERGAPKGAPQSRWRLADLVRDRP